MPVDTTTRQLYKILGCFYVESVVRELAKRSPLRIGQDSIIDALQQVQSQEDERATIPPVYR